MNRLVFLLVLAGLLLAAAVRAAPAAAGAPTWESARTPALYLEASALIPATTEYSEVRYAPGDDPRWAAPAWDDSAWAVAAARKIPSHTGIFWVRFKVRDLAGALPPGIFLQATMAYELYWDGRLIGRSGVPANARAHEVAGVLDHIFTLGDDAVALGEHQVGLRISNHRNPFPADTMPFVMMILSPADYLARTDRENLRSAAVVGAGVMLAFAGLITWLLVDRRPVLLLFAGLCLSATLMQALFIARFVFGYAFDWHYRIWVAQVGASNIFALSLASIVVQHFRLPRWTWIPVLLAPLCGQLAWMWQSGTRVVLPVLLLLALSGAVWAAVLRRRGAWLVAGGILGTLLLWVADPLHFLSPAFMRYFLPTLLGLTIAVALTLRDEKRRAQQAQLTAARLEIELLKKNLQPHFLLNTLTAVSEVIERDPAGAVAFIDDLAVEFRSLAAMSGERLVPLQRELELCRAHLKVLERRTGRRLELVAADLDETALVPPALFLTLIENSLVHQAVEGAPAFALSRERDDAGAQVYGFVSRGAVRPAAGRNAGGTGLRYVRARLDESFPGRWQLEQDAVAEGWRTVIRWRTETAGGLLS